jgi:hypothetical protein
MSRDLAEGRYVDEKYQTLPASRLRQALVSRTPEDALLAVAKRMPVRIRVRADQRKLNILLAECGNSKLPVEVRQSASIASRRAGQPRAAAGWRAGGEGFGGGGLGSGGGSRWEVAAGRCPAALAAAALAAAAAANRPGRRAVCRAASAGVGEGGGFGGGNRGSTGRPARGHRRSNLIDVELYGSSISTTLEQ